MERESQAVLGQLELALEQHLEVELPEELVVSGRRSGRREELLEPVQQLQLVLHQVELADQRWCFGMCSVLGPQMAAGELIGAT